MMIQLEKSWEQCLAEAKEMLAVRSLLNPNQIAITDKQVEVLAMTIKQKSESLAKAVVTDNITQY